MNPLIAGLILALWTISRNGAMITIAVTCFLASVYFIATGGFDIGKWFFFASLAVAAMKVFP